MADEHDPAPAPPAPKPSTTGRALRRGALRLVAMLLLVLLLAAGAALLFPDQLLAPLALRAAASEARQAGGDFTADSLRGGLRGPWIVEGLRWRALDESAALRDARVVHAEITGSAWDLLLGRAGWLHAVAASGIDLRLDLTATAAGPGNASLRGAAALLDELPSVSLDHATVHAVRPGGQPLEASDVSLQVGAPGGSRAIAANVGALSGAGMGDRPAAVRGRFTWGGGALQVDELAVTGGPLDGVAVEPGARIELVASSTAGADALAFTGRVTAAEGSAALVGRWDGGLLQSHVSVEDASVGGLWRRLAGAPGPEGNLSLEGDVSVPLERPLELTGALDVTLAALALGGGAGTTIDTVAGRVELGGGAARLLDVQVAQGGTVLQAKDLRIPFGVRSARDVLLQGAGRVHLQCRDVPALLAALGAPAPSRVVPEHALEVTALLDHGVFELLDGSLVTPGGRLAVQRGRIDLSGNDLLAAPLDVDAQVAFDDLAPLGPIFDPLFGFLASRGAESAARAVAGRWSGSLSGSAHADGSVRDVRASVELAGEKVVLAGWPLGELTLRLTADRRTLVLEDLQAKSRAADLQASGRCDLSSEELADVQLRLDLKDASRLPVTGLSGALSLAVTASGPLRAPAASLSLRSDGLSLPAVSIARLVLEAQAEGGGISVRTLEASTSLGDVTARGTWARAPGQPGQPMRVRVEEFAARHEGLDLLLAAPLDVVREDGLWRCEETELSGTAGLLRVRLDAEADGTQSLVVRAEALRPVPVLVMLLPGEVSLERVQGELRLGWGGDTLRADGSVGATGVRFRLGGAQLAGDVEARVALAGTLSAPRGTADVTARELSVAVAGEDDPRALGGSLVAARLLLDERGLQLSDLTIDAPKRVRLNAHGSLGAVPDLDALAAGGRALPPDAPLDLELNVSAGDLAFMAAMFSDVRRVEGVLGADVEVRGTLADPQVTGTVTVTDGELRLATGFPALDALRARMEFAGRTATIREFTGEMGAAPFEVTGRFGLLPDGAALDIALRGEDLLLYRGNGVKIRADTDVEVRGTLSALQAKGSLVLRDSRFERNVNFLHLAAGVGGRPGGGLQLFSFREPPLSTMALDLRVTASEPLVVDNNIAQGEVLPDLHLGGTGLVPVVEGKLTLVSTRVALPAGTVRSTSGLMLFESSDPFHPTLDITAQTQMRGYDITIVISGAFDQPRVSMSSVPPLPSDELLLLVITGQPPGDASLLSNSTRNTFAVYLGQDLLARWLGEESGGDELVDRLDVEIARDVSRPNVDIMRVSYRLTGRPDVENPLTFLSAEKDIYDRVNFGLQFLYKMP